MVSTAKVLEMQPSLRDVLENGIKYTVVKWAIVSRCPKLMPILMPVGARCRHVSMCARAALAMQMRADKYIES